MSNFFPIDGSKWMDPKDFDSNKYKKIIQKVDKENMCFIMKTCNFIWD